MKMKVKIPASRPVHFLVIFFGAVRLALPAPAADELLAPALGRHAVYEVSASISQEPEASSAAGDRAGGGERKAPAKSLAERSTTLSYFVFPGSGESERRMLLLRSVTIRVNELPLPATNEALVYRVGKDLETTLSGETPEEARVSAYELHLPSALFPRFELPENIGKEAARREEDITLLGSLTARLPVEVKVEKAGSTLKVVRRLEPGKTAKLEFEGDSLTLEAWSETHVIDLERKIVAELRRELKLLTTRGPQRFRTSATHELKAKDVRVLDPADRERATAVWEGVASILDDFKGKKPAREIYGKIQALGAKDGAKLFTGLPEALLSRFASYRQGLDEEAREKKRGATSKGGEAADFTLESLQGKPVSFRAATRGKVVLLSFWGYGCGPCRREAPYLSKLQEKYGERGFTVMAVNGYDEPKGVVQGFVEGAGLKQPVLLMGRSVAQEKYGVRAFPTNFWINHEGKVVHKDVGFSEGDFQVMEARVERLLQEAAKATEKRSP